MSWFSSLFGSDTHEEVGNQVLTAYYEAAFEFDIFREKYPSYGDFLTWAERATTLRKDIGELIENTKLTNSVSSAISRAQDLAFKSMGQAAQGDIIRAAGGTGDSINWTVFIPEVSADIAVGVGEEALDIAQNIGTGVTGTLKLTKYLPYIALGAGAFLLWSYSGSVFKSNPRKNPCGSKKKKNPDNGEAIKTSYKGVEIFIVKALSGDLLAKFILNGVSKSVTAPSMQKLKKAVQKVIDGE